LKVAFGMQSIICPVTMNVSSFGMSILD